MARNRKMLGIYILWQKQKTFRKYLSKKYEIEIEGEKTAETPGVHVLSNIYAPPKLWVCGLMPGSRNKD